MSDKNGNGARAHEYKSAGEQNAAIAAAKAALSPKFAAIEAARASLAAAEADAQAAMHELVLCAGKSGPFAFKADGNLVWFRRDRTGTYSARDAGEVM